MTAEEFVAHVRAQCGVLPAPTTPAYGTELSPCLHVGQDHVASPDTGEVLLLPKLIALDQRAREIAGFPLATNAGYRTVAHEDALRAKGYKMAGFVSPHSLGCALDKRLVAPKAPALGSVNQLLRLSYQKAARELGLPAPRLGHKAYGETFTHVDLVFLLFAPYTELPHPSTWLELTAEQRHAFTAWMPGVEW